MSSWFAGINQAASGLAAARYGLSVVAQNMTNASTPGYTRQTAEQSAVDMGVVSGIFSGHGSLGGVEISGTSRGTDPVLDARVRSEHARGALTGTTASQLSAIETALGEPSDTGLAAQLDEFWNAWGTVANDSSASSARTVLLRDASAVAASLNSMSDSLAELSAGAAHGLAGDVDAVNTAAAQLATVNGSIAVGTATGANVNSLLDARDRLLDTLSTLAGATATIEANGSATVAVGGQTLVSGVTASTMTTDSSFAVSVGGQPASVASGSIAARVSALTSTLPGYAASLDAVADRLSSTVNTAQAAGYDLSGGAGAAMFAGSGADGIEVVLTDPAGVAASGVPGGSLNGANALALSQTGLRPDSPDAAFVALVGNVASTSAAAQQRAGMQDSVASYVDSLKASVSGVSLDEEAATMLIYQQAFNASSRVLTAIDQMLDTLINHTGVVGRS